ncbi:MAG TPA: hypothetical protein VGQ91_13585 [Ideonella sp.]|nr:hypothetical protein [Ideonella sp.]
MSASAVLGQTLSLPVPLHLEPGERIGPECVSAEVSMGERALGREQVRVRLEPGSSGTEWIARVTTTNIIEEPVIEVSLTVGCERRFSRRFVAFADPPTMAANVAPAMQPPRAGLAGVPMVANEAGPAAEAPLPPATAAAPSSAERRRTRSAQSHAPAASAAAAKPRTAARRPVPMATRSAAAHPRGADNGPRLMLEIAGPRLKLDLEDPVLVSPIRPAGAGSAPEAAEVPEAERLRALEKTLADLQRESQAGREAATALKARLADAEYSSRAVPWLAALLILSLAVAAWLTLRLRRQQEAGSAQPQWWTPAAPPPPVLEREGEHGGGSVDIALPSGFGEPERIGEHTAPLPATLSIERSLPARAPEPPASTSSPVRADGPYESTTALPAAFRMEPAQAEPAAREVSVEELLDLEQQADFFIALGQEDAAVDLLMSHLRSTGGLSPLPYTKLLEIYRRQGDREAYERIRARFNRRFNAYAPDWDVGPTSGRALEDYAPVVRELQSLWGTPLDAMATLEAMLFRKDDEHELFDLPAYRDVLLLYALARDLWQQGGNHLSAVDVLLPLGDEADAPATAAWAHGTAPAPLQTAHVIAPPVAEEEQREDGTPPRRDLS